MIHYSSTNHPILNLYMSYDRVALELKHITAVQAELRGGPGWQLLGTAKHRGYKTALK